MLSKRQFNLLVYLMVALLVLNLSAIGTLLWLRSKPATPTFKECTVSDKYKRHSFRKYDEKIQERVGFDEAQMEAFRALRAAHFEEIRSITREIHQTRQLHFATIRKAPPEVRKLDSLNNRVGVLHQQWSESTTRFLMDAVEISTPEQREALFDLLEEGHKRFASRRRAIHGQHNPHAPGGSCSDTPAIKSGRRCSNE